MKTLLTFVFAAVLAIPAIARGADDDRAAIEKMANAFVEAFGKGDSKALSEFWAPDGDYIDPDGRVLKGRAAIAADFADLFAASKGLAARIEVASLRFPTPDTAIEDGVTSVLSPEGGMPSRTRYTNTLVKLDGRWLLSSCREAPYVPPTNADNLRPLAWLVGEWAHDAQDGHVAVARFDWSPDHNFILVNRAVAVRDVLLDNGTARIGWDPAAKSIRTWSFECDGGFSEGNWVKVGDNWVSKTSAVLGGGQLMTSTTIMTHPDASTITWQATEQRVNGKPLPDSPVIRMKHVGSAPATQPAAAVEKK